MKRLILGCVLALSATAAFAHGSPALPGDAAFDARVQRLMREARVPGLGLAVVHGGKIDMKAYGFRDVESSLPLTPDTTMYGASLTKGAFAYAVMTLVDEGRLDLDRSIADYLPKPLPGYAKYADLAGDGRWRKLTPRILLSHTSGLPNFRFFTDHGYDENAKLFFAFDPGARFAYSGEGINLLQFVIETGLGIDVGELMQQRVFDRFGMHRTSMTWRDDFAANVAIGYDEQGKPLGHKQRGGVRAAGSMDTTLADAARFLAALSRGDGLSKASRSTMLDRQTAIRSVQQFPTLSEETTRDNDGIGLGYGLGWAVYDAPQGRAFFKSGHDDGTNNLALCIHDGRDCVLILSNSSNAEGIFLYLIQATLGEACFPWFWENYIPYDHPELRDATARALPHPPCTPLR
jgi:CubicO group peptidase (beta-lactamase class C family)